MVCAAGWRFGILRNVLAFLLTGLNSHHAPVPCRPSELFGSYCCPIPGCFASTKTFPFADHKLLFTFPQLLKRLRTNGPVKQSSLAAESCPLSPLIHTDKRVTMRAQHFRLGLYLISLCQLLHFIHTYILPLIVLTYVVSSSLSLLPLSARLKTRRRPWKRPRPTPPSLWPAWPTRSMP